MFGIKGINAETGMKQTCTQ